MNPLWSGYEISNSLSLMSRLPSSINHREHEYWSARFSGGSMKRYRVVMGNTKVSDVG